MDASHLLAPLNDAQRQAAEAAVAEAEAVLGQKIVTPVLDATTFWLAEDYHQDFYRRNPLHPYTLAVTRPKLKKVEPLIEELKKNQ